MDNSTCKKFCQSFPALLSTTPHALLPHVHFLCLDMSCFCPVSFFALLWLPSPPIHFVSRSQDIRDIHFSDTDIWCLGPEGAVFMSSHSCSLACMQAHAHPFALHRAYMPTCPHTNGGAVCCDTFFIDLFLFLFLFDITVHVAPTHACTHTHTPIHLSKMHACMHSCTHLHASGGCWPCGMFWSFFFYFYFVWLNNLCFHPLMRPCTHVRLLAHLQMHPDACSHPRKHPCMCIHACLLACSHTPTPTHLQTHSHPYAHLVICELVQRDERRERQGKGQGVLACVREWTVKLNYHHKYIVLLV